MRWHGACNSGPPAAAANAAFALALRIRDHLVLQLIGAFYLASVTHSELYGSPP